MAEAFLFLLLINLNYCTMQECLIGVPLSLTDTLTVGILIRVIFTLC